MRLENIKVYDLEESLGASGYPMRTVAVYERFLERKLESVLTAFLTELSHKCFFVNSDSH